MSEPQRDLHQPPSMMHRGPANRRGATNPVGMSTQPHFQQQPLRGSSQQQWQQHQQHMTMMPRDHTSLRGTINHPGSTSTPPPSHQECIRRSVRCEYGSSRSFLECPQGELLSSGESANITSNLLAGNYRSDATKMTQIANEFIALPD